MTPQQHQDLKWLMGQKQWQTSFKQAMIDEANNEKDKILNCKTDDELRILKATISVYTVIKDIIEQRVEQYENEKENKQ